MQKLLDKAKIQLMFKGSVFLSTLVFSLRHSFSDKIQSAGTDGINVIYNPDYFKNLAEEARVSLIGHEAWHIGFDHLLRRGDRLPKEWNYAGDYVIDNMMHKAGFDMTQWGFVTDKYDNWSTVRVYNDIIENNRQIPQDFIQDILPLGSTSDKSLTNEELKIKEKELENVIKGILVKANTQSKLAGEKAGNLPGELSRTIDDLINPKLDYTEFLYRFMDDHFKDDYTWAKPNRRYFPDYYLPSQHSEAISNITIAIDTSGSIDKEQYLHMLSSIISIYEHYTIKELTILDCDQKIHNIHTFTKDSYTDILDLEFSGGGGTSFQPVINYCNEHPPKVLLYFTDLDARQITKEPDYPIIWLCYSNHSPAPIGQTIYYKMD